MTDTTTWAHLNQISDVAEMLWIEIKPGGLRKILLGIIYRPPRANRLQFLEDFKEKLDAITHIGDREVHITGDFNMDTLDITNVSKGKALVQLAKGYGLQQHISSPTRVTPTRSSVLDLYFTNCQHVAGSGVTSTNISDHEQIYLYKKKAPLEKKKASFLGRIYKNYDPDTFSDKLQNLDWDEVLAGEDVDALWDTYLERILIRLGEMCPIKEISVTNLKEEGNCGNHGTS